MASKPEATFQGLIRADLLREGFHPVEIPDDSKKGGSRFGAQFSATSAKPYDMGCLDERGQYAALELKVEDGISWPFSKLTESEDDGLRAVCERGQPGLILIRFFCRLGPQQKKIVGTQEAFLDEVWALHYLDMKRMQDRAHTSFHIRKTAKYGRQLQPNGKKSWKIQRTIQSYRKKKYLTFAAWCSEGSTSS